MKEWKGRRLQSIQTYPVTHPEYVSQCPAVRLNKVVYEEALRGLEVIQPTTSGSSSTKDKNGMGTRRGGLDQMTPILSASPFTLPSRLVCIGTMIVTASVLRTEALWTPREKRYWLGEPNDNRLLRIKPGYAAAMWNVVGSERPKRTFSHPNWGSHSILIQPAFSVQRSQPAACSQSKLTFDPNYRWIFSSMQNPENARNRFGTDRLFEMKSIAIELTTDLRKRIKSKIRLASKGGYQTRGFFDDVVRPPAVQFQRDEARVNQPRQHEQKSTNLAMPLAATTQPGLFSKDSLLAKGPPELQSMNFCKPKCCGERDEQLLSGVPRRSQTVDRHMESSNPDAHRTRTTDHLLNDKVQNQKDLDVLLKLKLSCSIERNLREKKITRRIFDEGHAILMTGDRKRNSPKAAAMPIAGTNS